MHSYIRIALIILLFPLSALAHGLEPELEADPGRLPGDLAYLLERPAEWLEVNIFTLSTKKKQEKKLQFSSERAAELAALLYVPNVKERHLQTGLARYRHYLASAEDMAEKIIFLDGAEIGIADRFEEESRFQEKFLRELKEGAPGAGLTSQIDEALALARIQNEKIFRFMVEKYQADEVDIRKHQIILGKHINLVKESLATESDEAKNKIASDFLTEAEKFRAAGLHVESYNLIGKAKDIAYLELRNTKF